MTAATTTTTTTFVCFRTARGQFALPVEVTLAVRRTDGLVDLPAPRPDIVGVLPGEPPITVLSALGGGANHILVVSCDDQRYGLHVLEVVGVRRVDNEQIGPAPKGQEGGLISGVLNIGADMVLIADARALAARL